MNFEDISKDLDEVVQKLGKLQTVDADTRQRLDLIVAKIQEQHEVMRAELPPQLARHQEKIATAKETVARVRQQLAAQKAELAAAKAKPPAVPQLPAVAPTAPVLLNPSLCSDLSDDLLRHFGTTFQSKPAPSPDMQESVSAMDEQQWTEQKPQGRETPKKPGPSKPEVADEWPEELRTPSSKKPTTKIRPKAPPKPASDDESIGKSWGNEGES